jgi:hypothetical protein
MDAVLLELQIQIGVGKATERPVLRSDNLAWHRLELETDLSPGAAPPARPSGRRRCGRLAPPAQRRIVGALQHA